MTLQLTVVQRQANIVQDIHNVFHYEESVPVTSNAQVLEFINQWISVIQPAILGLQSDQVVHMDVRAEVIGGLFFSNVPQGLTDGVIACTAANPYTAYEFIYNRATRLTRNGFKRFAGVCEEFVDQGGNVTGTALGAIGILETALDDVLNMSWGTARPVIFGRPTPPPSSLPARVNDITSVSFQRVTTQNSRKPWL